MMSLYCVVAGLVAGAVAGCVAGSVAGGGSSRLQPTISSDRTTQQTINGK
jgi:hypothetical protein